MEPKAFKYLISKQEDIENKKGSHENDKEENDYETQPPKENINTNIIGNKYANLTIFEEK